VKVFDYSHTAAPDYYAEHQHTLVIVQPPPGGPELPDVVLAPGHYLKRYLVDYRELDPPPELGLPEGYRVYTRCSEDSALEATRHLRGFRAHLSRGLCGAAPQCAAHLPTGPGGGESPEGIAELLQVIEYCYEGKVPDVDRGAEQGGEPPS
jgi:carbonic anhydrase